MLREEKNTKKDISIIQKIKNFFQRRKQKALPESTKNNGEYLVNNINYKNEAHNEFKDKRKELINSVKAGIPANHVQIYKGIDAAIEQYLMAEVYNYEHNIQASPYETLIRLCSGEHSKKNNRVTEVTMLNALRNTGKYNIIEQGIEGWKKSNQEESLNSHSSATFYHIKTQGLEEKNFKYDTRIYINPKRENIVSLVAQILNKMGNNPMYLKILADDKMKDYELKNLGRSEKIVIYADSSQNGNLRKITNAIAQIKKENPRLFENCQNMNPFLKTIEGIAGYAKEPTTDTYKQLDGKELPTSKSYNSFLSAALNDSVTKTLNDISYYNAIPNFNSLNRVQKIKMLLETSSRRFINGVKDNLTQCQKNNSVLDIKGINTISRNDLQK